MKKLPSRARAYLGGNSGNTYETEIKTGPILITDPPIGAVTPDECGNKFLPADSTIVRPVRPVRTVTAVRPVTAHDRYAP